MGWPAGNKFAQQDRRWKKAIENALAKRSRAAGIEALDDLAEKLLTLCEQGDIQALKELGNRIEGMSVQNVDAQVDGALTVKLVRFGDPDGDQPPE